MVPAAARLRERADWPDYERLVRGGEWILQLLPGRADEDFEEYRPSFQINLILDDPKHPRVGFITVQDAGWTRNAARKLADYLGVPLVDQIPASA